VASTRMTTATVKAWHLSGGIGNSMPTEEYKQTQIRFYQILD